MSYFKIGESSVVYMRCGVVIMKYKEEGRNSYNKIDNKMIRTLFVLLFLIFIYESCLSKANKQDIRKDLINRTIHAIEVKDTIALYSLIDTSFCFRIWGKEAFLYKINYAYERFKVCSSNFKESNVKITNPVAGTKEYSIPFCRDAKDSIVYDSFDLILGFADYEQDKKIMSFDVEIYREGRDIIIDRTL